MRRLHGRDVELGRLEELVASVGEGAGGVVLVEGPAGIGKSRLLAEVSLMATGKGLHVAQGGADELDQVTPWGPLLVALSSGSGAVLPFGELEAVRSLNDQRLAVIERMQAALEKASSSRPLLIILDDLQWADAASLQAVASLSRLLFSYAVGWVLASRPLPVRPELQGVLERLEEAGATRFHLGPLTSADALAMARDSGAEGTDHDVARRVADAEGNPFYILELVKTEARADGVVDIGSGTGLSASSGTAVSRHLRSLSEDSRRLLQVASVLGREFSVTEVEEMTTQPASQLLGPVEEAVRAELLIDAPAGLAFRHDLLRQAAYESIPASMRLALHRQAAEALRKSGAPLVRIASHLAIGASTGDVEAIREMQQAVDELAPSSPGAAADLALRVLQLAGEDAADRAQMVSSAVYVLGLAGRSALAHEVGERYLSTHRPPAAVEAELQLQLRKVWVFNRNDPYPAPPPDRILTDPEVRPDIVAALEALDQMRNMVDGRVQKAEQSLAAAMNVVLKTGDPSYFWVVAVLQVLNSMYGGRCAEALSRAEAALATMRRAEDRPTPGVYEEIVTAALTANGRVADALAMMQVPLAGALEAGRAGLVFRYRRLRAALLLSQGRLDDADAEARGDIAMAMELGYPHRVSLPLSVVAETATRRGDLGAARSALACYGRPLVGFYPDLIWARALVAWAGNNRAAAMQELAPVHAELESGNAFGLCFLATTQHHRLPQLVHIALAAGNGEAAQAFAQALARLTEHNPDVPSFAAASSQVQGLLCLDVARLRDAVQLASASEDRLLEAAAREDLALPLAREKDGEAEAVGQLNAANEF